MPASKKKDSLPRKEFTWPACPTCGSDQWIAKVPILNVGGGPVDWHIFVLLVHFIFCFYKRLPNEGVQPFFLSFLFSLFLLPFLPSSISGSKQLSRDTIQLFSYTCD
ncbi:hypothetical protein BC830DRAFT_559517 [Chytriomyces sp. MP71]|nr:hypothetical protein BC830DRAFT_559517 [Chytriomyces sp. MP71]